MGVLDQVRQWFGLSRSASLASPAIADAAHGLVSGVIPFGQPPIRGTADLIRSGKTSPWFHAVSMRIAGSVASTPWRAYVARDSVAEKTRRTPVLQQRHIRSALHGEDLKELKQHPLIDLLEKPNPVMTGYDFLEVTQRWLDGPGEAFWIRERGRDGTTVQLWPVPPHWLLRAPTPDSPAYEFSFLTYRATVPDTEVIALRHLDPENPYGRGVGTGFALGDEIETYEYAAKTAKAHFWNNGIPAALVAVEGASKESVEAVKEKWASTQGGFLNAMKVAFVAFKATVTQLTPRFVDQQIIELMKAERDSVIQVFGVPPEVLGVLENANRATVTAAETHYARWVVAPRLEMLRRVIHSQLGCEYADGLIINFDSPVPEDRDFELQVATAAPWTRSKNEWRALQGLEPIKGGDEEFAATPGAMPGLLGLPPGPAGADPAWAANEKPAAPAEVPAPADGEVAPRLEADQVESLLEVLKQVTSGQIPRDTAVALIQTSFALSKEAAEAIVGSIGNGFVPAAPPETTKSARTHERQEEQEEQDEQDDSTPLGDDDAKAIRAAIDRIDSKPLSDSVARNYEREMQAFVEEAARVSGIEVDFDVVNPLVEEHAKQVATEHMRQVTETTRGYLRDALAAGIAEGEDTRTIRKRLLEVPGFDGGDARAVMVARTEVNRSSNYGQVESWKASDGAVSEKRWIATADSTTRESHRELNGQVQQLDKPFVVNGHSAMYPGEFGLGSEDINCRCTMGAVIDDPDISDIEDAAGWWFKRGAEPSEEQLARAWRAYVKAVAPWEKRTAGDVKRGFGVQRADFEDALDAALGSESRRNTKARGGSRS